MGWHILAYLHLDQTDIKDYIARHGIDDEDAVAEHFTSHHGWCVCPCYAWNEEDAKHEIFDMYQTKFLLDHPLLNNATIPLCLHNINFTLKTPEDAKEIAATLRAYFPDEPRLMNFANWCENTSHHCLKYELSY
jgi:hypothetical protein